MTPASAQRTRRAPVVALIVAALSGSVILGLVVARLQARHAPVAHAAGLRASPLPLQLDRIPAPRIRLGDARGGIVDTRRLRGRPYLVTFLYARCPDVCPAIAHDVGQALRTVGTRRVAAVAVSVDPRGDTAAAVRGFLRRNRAPADFAYGIGSRAQLRPVWRDWSAAPQIADRPESSSHTAAVWLVDARGRLRALYAAGAPLAVGDLVHDLRVLVGERRS